MAFVIGDGGLAFDPHWRTAFLFFVDEEGGVNRAFEGLVGGVPGDSSIRDEGRDRGGSGGSGDVGRCLRHERQSCEHC